jgi:LuxR family maltose regulon positive regulatory protein
LHILRCIAAGKSNQVIAQELVIAKSTVKTHVSNIYGKLGVHSRTQALVQARKMQFLR